MRNDYDTLLLPYRYKNVGEQVFLVGKIPHKEAYGLARN